MAKKDEPTGRIRNPWKRKMGVEFSGLQGPRDFLVGLLFVVLLVGAGMVIAFLSFG